MHEAAAVHRMPTDRETSNARGSADPLPHGMTHLGVVREPDRG